MADALTSASGVENDEFKSILSSEQEDQIKTSKTSVCRRARGKKNMIVPKM